VIVEVDQQRAGKRLIAGVAGGGDDAVRRKPGVPWAPDMVARDVIDASDEVRCVLVILEKVYFVGAFAGMLEERIGASALARRSQLPWRRL